MTRQAAGWLLVAVQGILLVVLVLVPRVETDPARLVVGIGLVVAGCALGLVAGARLGAALTPTPVPTPEAGLRTSGPYRYLRHPIYTAVLLIAIGYTVAIGSWWSAAVCALLAVFFWGKSRWEDALLREAYGDDWRIWAAETGALLPSRHGRWRHD